MQNEKLAYSISDVQHLTGIGKTALYQLINSKNLPARKLNSKTIILKADLDHFLESLKPYPTKEGEQNV